MELLRTYRDEERHEIAWINNRLQWLLITQSFLLTIAVTLLSNDYELFPRIVMGTVLWVFALVLAGRAFVAIRAAQVIIEAWMTREGQLRSDYPDILDKVSLNRGLHNGNRKSDRYHETAASYHRQAPVLLAIMWACYAGALYGHGWLGTRTPITTEDTVFASIVFVSMAIVVTIWFVTWIIPEYWSGTTKPFEDDVGEVAKRIGEANQPPMTKEK
jgi:hypothetical protein